MANSTSLERVEQCGGPREWLANLGEGDLTPSKLLTVMLLGALGSLGLYYIYSSLAPETRDNLKDQVVSTVKANIHKLTQQ